MKRRLLCGAALFCFVAMSTSAVSDVERGKSLYLAGDYEPATRIFERVLDGRATDEIALYYLGRIYLDHSDLDRAEEYFEKLVEIMPGNSAYQLALGEVYGEKARTSGFLLSKKKWAGKWKKQLEIAFELDPRNLDAREWLAVYLLNAPGFGGGDKDRGTRIARETIGIDEVFGQLLLGYAHRRSGRVDLAIATYNAALDADPRNSRAYRGLGYCYLKKEEFDEAESSFARAIEVAPDDAAAYEAMAHYWAERGSQEEQAENLESALRLKPLLSDARYELALNYQSRDQTPQAIRHYEELIARTPKHHKAGKAKRRLRKLENPRRSR